MDYNYFSGLYLIDFLIDCKRKVSFIDQAVDLIHLTLIEGLLNLRFIEVKSK